MKPELPVNRASAPHRPNSGVQGPSGPSSSEKAPSAQAGRREHSAMAVRVERHGRWDLLGRAQSQLSHLQGAEKAVVDSYRELLQLMRQLERSQARGDQLSSRVADLRQQLNQTPHLDGNLRLQHREGPRQASYLLDRVDLLSPRPQGERLNIQLPNGPPLTLQLAANSSPDDQLRQLQQAFEPHGLKADRNDQGQLRLRGAEALLSSPWVFRGQGIRVPAGNPVPIQLGAEPDQLSQLQAGLDKGNVQAEKQRLRDLLSTLEQQRRTLENQRQQLLRQISQLRTSDTGQTEQHLELSGAVRQTLQNGDFTLQLNTLMAQANVSRFSVVALLGR